MSGMINFETAEYNLRRAQVLTGTGTPEAVRAAPIGSLYTDLTNLTTYSKDTGTGATGWVRRVLVRTHTATPEGAIVGSIGDLCVNTGGGAATTLYVKTSGTATNTGWTAK